jgi:hypothetical protein
MIAWVDNNCRQWGAHKRWLVYGTHNGYPPLSILGRLIIEGPGAGEHMFRPRVLVSDDPLAYTLVSVSLAKMADTHEMEEPYACVWAHYFFAGRAKNKAPAMEMPLRSYWQHLHAAHAFISACEVGDVSRELKSCARNLACA